MRKLVVASFSLGLMAGCSTVDSEFYSTGGIFAALVATADGNGTTTVSATFHEGSADSLQTLKLTGGDEATVHMDAGAESATKPMVEKSGLGVVWYESEFYIELAGTEFTLNLDRNGTGNESAPDSTTVLPEPFAISTNPANMTTFSRSNTDFSLLWNTQTGNEPQGYRIEGTCIESQEAGMAANFDAFDIGPSYVSLVSRAGQEDAYCDVTFTIYRKHSGVVDSAYGKGGFFEGIQTRTEVFQSTP